MGSDNGIGLIVLKECGNGRGLMGALKAREKQQRCRGGRKAKGREGGKEGKGRKQKPKEDPMSSTLNPMSDTLHAEVHTSRPEPIGRRATFLRRGDHCNSIMNPVQASSDSFQKYYDGQVHLPK